jgi:serine/threonine-protein kinase
MSTEVSAISQDITLPKEGDVIAGKYLIQRVLGRGGMGVVVAAEHVTLRQRVAVKFLLPEAVARAGSVERFLREARSAVMIQSEHVARVFDVGTLDTGSPYMVMELLQGSDLGELLDAKGKLPIDQAVDYVLQACEAIAEAHALGIIHRDLKPANLFLTSRSDGSSLVKVLDFGLSKPPKTDALDASLTQANAIMGSPFYMSPEQIRSLKGLDSRGDIWSIGVILYQLIAGVRPFEAESLGALFLMIGADAPASLKDHRPDAPDALVAAVMRCLEKDPPRRTQSVSELALALAPFGTEGSALSVERIVRLLPVTALPVRGSITSENDPLRPDSLMPGAAGAAKPGSMPPPAPPPPGATEAARSGSMQAVTSSVPAGSASGASSAPSAPPAPAAEAPRKSRAPLLVVAAIAALGLGGTTFALRPGKARAPVADVATEHASPAASGPSSAAATQAPTVAPAVEVPAATASATASAAASSAPSAAASASSTPSAAAVPAGKAPKAKAPPGAKKKDPLERWR